MEILLNCTLKISNFYTYQIHSNCVWNMYNLQNWCHKLHTNCATNLSEAKCFFVWLPKLKRKMNSLSVLELQPDLSHQTCQAHPKDNICKKQWLVMVICMAWYSSKCHHMTFSNSNRGWEWVFALFGDSFFFLPHRGETKQIKTTEC